MKQPLHQSLPPVYLKRSLTMWGSLILAGLFAYGIGLYQGSRYRIERTVAALTPPTPMAANPADSTSPSTSEK